MSFSILTIILFFIYSWGLGYSITYFLKNSENALERNLIRIGIGLGVFVVLGVIFNAIHIPLDWRIFLVLSMILPIVNVARGKIKFPEIQLTKENIYVLLALIIFLVSLFIYTSGAFKYPYLEDDDSWTHATSIKYVSVEKTVSDPENFDYKYIDPYPPGYNILMGALHQTSSSLMWTLKFFNALIVSLSILMFFFFAKKFTNSGQIALFATVILAAVPSFLTHFIWAHSLVIMLFFPAIYCLEMIKNDKKWIYPAMILIASILLTQASQAIKIGIMFGGYFIIKCVYAKRFLLREFFALGGGLLVSLIWWFNRGLLLISSKVQRATTTTLSKYAERLASIDTSSIFGKFLALFPPQGGTATRVYTFSDFFFAKPFGGINVTVGWGIAISILLIIALIFIISKYKELIKSESTWIAVALFWFIFTFLGTNAMTFNLPIGFMTFRFWLLLAIPTSLLAAFGIKKVLEVCKNIKLRPQIILVIILLAILATSGYQKYSVNTAIWPPGIGWTSTEELQGYLWLKTLPIDTKVFTFYYTGKISGLDKFNCDWCEEVIEFRKTATEKSATELHSWLKEQQYEYIVISGSTAEKLGIDEANLKIQELISSDLFVLSHQTKDFFAFRIL